MRKMDKQDFKLEKITDIRVKNIFEEYIAEIQNGNKPSLYQLQIKHGYSPSSAKGYAVARTSTWRTLLEDIDDKPLIDRLQQIAYSGKDRDSIAAIQEIFKVKGRYPRSSMSSFDKDIYDLVEDNEEETS
jgi:hypothetical protein